MGLLRPVHVNSEFGICLVANVVRYQSPRVSDVDPPAFLVCRDILLLMAQRTGVCLLLVMLEQAKCRVPYAGLRSIEGFNALGLRCLMICWYNFVNLAFLVTVVLMNRTDTEEVFQLVPL